MKLAPSLIAADMTAFGEALDLCQDGGADLVHFDVMDGHFVPNLTIGIPVLEAVVKRTSLPVDVHLMVSQPENLLDGYLKAGAAWVSVHWEASNHLDRLLQRIREAGARAGVALNPATPVELLEDILSQLDYVVLMSVNPGFSGQAFIDYALDKARRLRQMIDRRGLSVDIEMDGGVGLSNIRQVVDAGVDICVTGSAAFGQEDPVTAMQELRRVAELGKSGRNDS